MFVLHCQSDLCMSIICNACSTLLNILRTVLCFSADGHGGIIQIERRLCCCVVFREIVRKKSNELLLTPSTSCFNQFLGVWELSVLKNLKYFVNIFYHHAFQSHPSVVLVCGGGSGRLRRRGFHSKGNWLGGRFASRRTKAVVEYFLALNWHFVTVESFFTTAPIFQNKMKTSTGKHGQK